MGIFEVKLKTHSRQEVDPVVPLNRCRVHNAQPKILDIVAGRRKEHHFVATCGHAECCKISMESPEVVTKIWNKCN